MDLVYFGSGAFGLPTLDSLARTHTISAAILAGDAETGNSVITLAERMDAGMILGQSRRRIDPMQTAGELHDALAGDGPALVERVLSEHIAGRLAASQQDDSLVTLAP